MFYPWHESTLQQLLARRKHLPHALLLHGQSGTGKMQLARFFAQSLLCEKVQDVADTDANIDKQSLACGECSACHWFAQGNHPDFRAVCPEALLVQAESDAASADGAESGDKKKASKEIRIDQIRQLADFVNLGTHRHGLRIILLYPAQALNLNAANALLKMLEEPPAQSLFLLVADHVDRLLPTILSRCQKIALPTPETAVALTWLASQGAQGIAAAQAEALLHEVGGAPLDALALSTAPEWRQTQQTLFAGLAQPERMDALSLADALHKLPLPTVTDWMQRWLYDVVTYSQTGRARYYPAQQTVHARLAQQMVISTGFDLLHQLAQFRGIATHPLNPRVQIEAMLLQYQRVFALKDT